MSYETQKVKNGHNAHKAAKKEYDNIKLENWTQCALKSPKMSTGAWNVKSRPNSSRIIENEPGIMKFEIGCNDLKWVMKHKTQSATWPSKTSMEVQNVNNGRNNLVTIENEFGIVKRENYTQRLRYHQKWVLKRKMWKLSTTTSKPPKMITFAQNLKNGCNAPGNRKKQVR
jgi:hypothetical protein